MKNNYYLISILFFFSGVFLIFCSNTVFKDVKTSIFTSIFKSKDINNEKENSNEEVVINNLEEDEHIINNVEIELSFIGDSLLASYKGIRNNMNFQDLLDTHEYSYPFKNVKHFFLEDDFTIANGENVFTDNDLLEREKDYNPAYWYFSKSRFANIYQESGIEIVSVMNNHTNDYGNQGYLDTIEALENSNVIVGLEDVIYLEKNNIKIALICTNLFHEFQANQVNEKIRNIKDSVNYIIVYFHGGVEYQFRPSENIQNYARSFVDNGANLVIGSHPHVLQPIEVYRGKNIVYSLGSFIFGDANFVNRTIIYQMKLEFNLENNTLIETDNIIPCYIYSSKSGYDKLIPSVIENTDEKKKVIDFMYGLREVPL